MSPGASWSDFLPELLAAIGGAALAAFLAWWIAWTVQRRTLRNDLSLRMSEAAYAAYRLPAQYGHWLNQVDARMELRQDARERLSRDWVDRRVALDAVQRSLDLYYGVRSPTSRQWHRLRDRLIVYFMLSAGVERKALEREVSRLSVPDHAHLGVSDLLDDVALGVRLRGDITAALDDQRAAHLLYRPRTRA